MTSGINWQEPLDGRPDSMIEMTRQQDWTRFVLDRPMANAPGEIFNYNKRRHRMCCLPDRQAHGNKRFRLCEGETVRPARDQCFELVA